MAWTWSSKQVDPIAYRVEEQWPVTETTQNWKFEPEKLKNADVNISAYWDDSSETNYNNPDLWGWENTKYKGENTKNTTVEYNPNATIEWLNPNYAYWQKAQMVNSWDAGYIQRRNDEIASALYNAGKTSIQDVADFLNNQTWFQNSTENERYNTIASVWKRLWEIWWNNSSNGNQNWNNANNNNWADNNSSVKNMEADLLKSNEWTLYWKNTADINWEDSAIRTLNDAYSVEQAVNRQRINNLKSLQGLSSKDIATSIVNWYTPYWDQGMRDLMQYDPAKYAEVQKEIKLAQWQKNINSITKEWSVDFTSQTKSTSSAIDNDITSFAFNNSSSMADAWEIMSTVNSTLNTNSVATTASEQMSNIEWDIAKLQTRLKNIDREARAAFKSDVPQYLVNAYKANKQQEIQDQINTLTSQYNMAANRYQNEWNNIKWQAEYSLKERQIRNQEKQQAIDNYFKQQQISLDWTALDAKYWDYHLNDVQTTTKTQAEIDWIVDNLVEKCENWELSNAQCAAWIQQNYLPYIWVDLGSLSAYSKKQGICNETDKANYIPKKWDLVVMSSSTKPENWHIGIVVWVDENTGTLKYMDWNGSVKDWVWTETAEVRSTTLSNSKIYWYYNPTKTNPQTDWNVGFNENFADIYSKFLQGQMYTEWRLNTAIRSVWAKDEEDLRNQAMAWKNSQKSNETAMMMLNAVEYLMSQWANKFQRQLAINDGKEVRGIWDVAWWIDRFFRWDAANYNSYYKYIKDNFTLNHLVELKNNWATFWALSNQELDAISSSALALASDMWSEQFNKQLFIIYNKLRKNVWESQLTQAQFDEMIWAEDDEKKQQYYLALYSPEKITEDPNEVLPEENWD